MDIFHKFFLVARKDALHSAPVIKNQAKFKILDLGTGTGICESSFLILERAPVCIPASVPVPTSIVLHAFTPALLPSSGLR